MKYLDALAHHSAYPAGMARVGFLAGPFSQGDTIENIHKAAVAWHLMRREGLCVLVPHTMTVLLHFASQRPENDWYAFDLEYLQVCHYLVRIPGPSFGADREEEVAGELGLTIYHGVEEAIEGERARARVLHDNREYADAKAEAGGD